MAKKVDTLIKNMNKNGYSEPNVADDWEDRFEYDYRGVTQAERNARLQQLTENANASYAAYKARQAQKEADKATGLYQYNNATDDQKSALENAYTTQLASSADRFKNTYGVSDDDYDTLMNGYKTYRKQQAASANESYASLSTEQKTALNRINRLQSELSSAQKYSSFNAGIVDPVSANDIATKTKELNDRKEKFKSDYGVDEATYSTWLALQGNEQSEREAEAKAHAQGKRTQSQEMEYASKSFQNAANKATKTTGNKVDSQTIKSDIYGYIKERDTLASQDNYSPSVSNYGETVEKNKTALKNKYGLSDDEFEDLLYYGQELYDSDSRKKQQQDAYNKVHQDSKLKNISGGIQNSIVALATNLAGGVGGLAETGKYLTGIGYRDKQSAMNVNSSLFGASNATSDYQGATQQALNDWNPTAGLLYGAGMSAIESAETSVLGGLGGASRVATTALSLAPFAANAYASSLSENVSDDQSMRSALTGALKDASIETLTEIASADKFWDMAKSGNATLRNKIVDWLAEAGIEGTEEVAGNIADRFLDSLKGSSSDYNKTVRSYIAQGMSENDAKNQATKDQISEDVESFLSGAISGGISGGIALGINSISNANTANNLFDGYTSKDYAERADALDTDPASYKNESAAQSAQKAKDLATKMSQEQTPSKKEKIQLYEYYQDIQNVEAEAAAEEQENAAKQQKWDSFKSGVKNALGMNKTTTTEQTTTDSAQESISDTSNVPEEYRSEKNNTSYNDAYKAIQSATTQDELNEAMQTAKNSEEISWEDYEKLEQTAGSYAASKNNLDLEQAKISTEDAYNEGYENPNAANPYTNVNTKNAIAFNEAQQNAKHDQEERRAQNKAVVEERAKLQLNALSSDFMNSHYNEDVDPAVYSDVVESALTAGRTAADINETVLSNPGVALVGEDLVRQAYATGAKAAAQEMIYEENNSANMTNGVRFGTGTFSDKRQNKSVAIGGLETLEVIAKVTGLDIELTDDEKVVKGGENGHYAPSKSTVYLNAEQAHRLAGTSYHEAFGEFAATWNQKEYAGAVNSILAAAQKHYGAAKYNAIRNRYAAKYKAVEENKTDIDLDKEMANDLLYKFFDSKEGMQELIDEIDRQNGAKEAKSIKQKLAEWLKKLADSIRDFMSTFTPNEFQRGIAEANLEHIESLRKEVMRTVAGAVRNYNEAKAQAEQNGTLAASQGEKIDTQTQTEIERHGLDTMAEAANLEFKKEGNLLVLYDLDGNRIENVTKDHIRETPLGAVLKSTKDNNFITKNEMDDQLEFFAGLLNQLQRTQDIDLVFAVNSVMGFQPLQEGERTTKNKNGLVSKNAALVSNSDPQYSKSGELTTICVKTQAVIDAMSETMKKLGRGLTEHEIIDIVYNEAHLAGEKVPCPVCYVFSRWVGLGGLFDNIKNLQDKYPIGIDTNTLRHDLEELDKKISATQKKLENAKKKSTKGKAREALYKELVEQRKPLEQLERIGKTQGKDFLSVEQKKMLATLNEQIGYLDNWTWLHDVRMNKNYKTQGYVPNEVLFDINAGTRFANEYPLAWKYRTTRGPALGKTATTYADEHLGQIIRGLGASNVPKDLGDLRKNSFLFERIIPKSNKMSNFRYRRSGTLNASASRMMNSAILKAAAQNLLNGQRIQSSSDFRHEYLLDYMLMFTELQAVGSGMQLYTKVPESVGLFASTGAEVNLSLMPYGVGYETDSDGNPVYDENGNVKLLFSKVTGMDPEDAFRLSAMYDNVQPIMVGTSPLHIEACGKDKRITFIIPYHASGSSEGRYRSQMQTVGEQVVSRTDFAPYQTEHERSDATPQQVAARNLRVDILTGKFKKDGRSLTEAEKDVLRANNVLHQLYQRFYGHDVDGNNAKIENKYLDKADRGADGYGNTDNNTYGVFLTKDQTKTIMPYEYWNKELTVDEATKNGDRFADYCESLGLYPRFSGYTSTGKYVEDGDIRRFPDAYWKTLPDRSMYNLDGTYHEQKAINISNMNLSYLDRSNMIQGISSPSVENDRSKVAGIVDKSIARIREEETKRNAGESVRHSYDLSVDENLVQMVEEVKEGTYSGNSSYTTTERISDETADKISDVVGFSVKGYSSVISATSISHVIHRHGDHGVADHSMANSEDIARVAYVINNADKVWEGENKSYEYKDSKNQPSQTVVMQKKIDDGFYYVVEAVPESKKHRLGTVSMYKNKNDTSPLVSNTDNGPAPHAQDELPANVSDTSVSRNDTNGKRNSLDIDSDDNSLTESQQKYFENSKVRDEDGRLLVMYHGTGADFTVFDKKYIGSHGSFEGYGFNFTPDKSRASGYSNGRILEGYLNVTNPLSDSEITMTTREFANLIAEADPTGDDIIANYAMNTRDYGTPAFVKREAMTTAKLIMESAQSDVDLYSEISAAGGGDNLIDLFKQMGYDGLIHHNENGSIKTVITFESNQFKNIDNQNPTQAADIRRAVGIDETWDDFDWSTEGEQIQSGLADALKSGNEILKGATVNEANIRRIARQLKNQYSSRISVDELADTLTKVFAYAQNQDYINYNDLATVISEVASPMIEQSTVKIGAQEFKDFKQVLQSYTFNLDERQQKEVISAFGSWGAFRKALPGIKFTRDGSGVSLDGVWDSLCQESGYVLSRDVTSNDMPLELVDAYNAMKPTYENAFGEDAMNASQDAAMEIVSKYYQYEAQQERNDLRKKQKEDLENLSKKIAQTNAEMRKNLQRKYNERLEKEIAKVKKENKPEKVSVQVARLRARNAKTVASLREAQKRKEKLKYLNKIANRAVEMLTNPTDQKHIPKMIQTPVMQLISAVDAIPETVRETADGKYTIRIIKSKHMNDDGSYSYDWETIKADTVQDAVAQYKKAMEEYGFGSSSARRWQDNLNAVHELYTQEEEDDWYERSELKQGLDKELGEQLGKILRDNRGMLSIAELSSDEIQTVIDVFRNVMHAANQINRMYSMPSQEVTDVAHQAMDRMSSGVNGRKAHGKMGNIFLDTFTLDHATPETFFHGLFGTKETDPITKILLKAQNQKARDIRQAQEYMEGFMTDDIKKAVKGWMYDAHSKDHNTRNFYGMDLTVTQVMSLYELMKREDAQQHKPGGFIVDMTGRKDDGRHNVVHLTDEQIKSITDTLSEEQKRIADAMQYYMAHQCAEQGNETAMQLYGYDKYLDEHYFPMATDKNAVATRNSNVSTGTINAIKNSGFTKKITPNANNALVLKDIFTVFADHVSDMATYHSWAAPIQDIIRFYNFNEKETTKVGEEEFISRTSVKDAFDYFYGKGGQQYMTKLLASINQMEKSNLVGGDFMQMMTGNAKSAAVMGNIRVVVQQPTAFFRAGEMISYKYLNDGFAGKYAKEAAELRDRTSDVFWLKNQGNIDGYITQSMVSTITGVQTRKEQINEKAGFLAGKADEVTWAAMYRAVYAEQVDKLGKAKIGTQEFEDAVNDRFSEIMLRTQVYDGTITRSQFMRSTDWYNKMASAFMAEPVKTYNIVLRHMIDLAQAKNEKDIKAAKQGIRRAAGVLTLTNLANAVGQSLWDSFRNAGDTDGEDENFWERFLEAIGLGFLVDDEEDTIGSATGKFLSGNFVDNMDLLGNIPLVADYWDAVKTGFSSAILGESSYSSDSDLSMSAINNFFSAVKAIVNPSKKMTNYGKFAAIARGFSDMTGIPVYAVQRDAVAIYNVLAKDVANGLAGAKLPVLQKTSKYTKAQQAKLDVYAEAMNSGDFRQAIEDAYNAGNSYESIRNSIKDKCKDEYLALKETSPSEATQMKNRLAQMYVYLANKTGTYKDKSDAEKLKTYTANIEKWGESEEDETEE